MRNANERAPSLREVLATAECRVFLEVVDLPPGGSRHEKTRTATAINGPTLVERLERSRVLAGNALLACRPTLRAATDEDGRPVIAASVSPFGKGKEGRA